MRSVGVNLSTIRLIEKFLNETGYKSDDNVVLIIAYGSRVASTFREDSDLDILIITSKGNMYRQSIIVSNVPIDITIMPVTDVEESILFSKIKGSTYFDTVFKNGIVVLDKIALYDNLKELLNRRINKKRSIDSELIERVEYHIYQFLNRTGDKNIHYFSALELMRKLYHAKHNCSNIQSSKVYDMYTDKKLAKEGYLLKLPDDKFINDYLIALQEKDENKQREWLMRFFKEIEDVEMDIIYKDNYFDISQTQIKLINLYHAVKKCQKMLSAGHPYSKSLFYVIAGEIYYLYNLIYEKEIPADFYISSSDVKDMVKILEKLFGYLDDGNIDYNNYKVRI